MSPKQCNTDCDSFCRDNDGCVCLRTTLDVKEGDGCYEEPTKVSGDMIAQLREAYEQVWRIEKRETI